MKVTWLRWKSSDTTCISKYVNSSSLLQKNSDNTIVPGALLKKPIDFGKVDDQIINEQSGESHEIIDGEIDDIDDIDPSEIHRAEPYFEFFKKETVKKLFSKKWQYKQDGYEAIINEFEK